MLVRRSGEQRRDGIATASIAVDGSVMPEVNEFAHPRSVEDEGNEKQPSLPNVDDVEATRGSHIAASVEEVGGHAGVDEAQSRIQQRHTEGEQVRFGNRCSDTAAVCGWHAGFCAMCAVPVGILAFMPIHTIINYQYSHGVDLESAVGALSTGGAQRFYAGIFFALPMVLLKRFLETFVLESSKAWQIHHTAMVEIGFGGATSALIAAVVAAMAQYALMPLDTLKTCSQASGDLHAFHAKVFSSDHKTALWAGGGAAAAAAFVSSLTFWFVFNALEATTFAAESLVHYLLRFAIVGFAAGATADAAVNCLRLWKVQRQAAVRATHKNAHATSAGCGTVELGFRTIPLRLLHRGCEGLVFVVLWKLLLSGAMAGHTVSTFSHTAAALATIPSSVVPAASFHNHKLVVGETEGVLPQFPASPTVPVYAGHASAGASSSMERSELYEFARASAAVPAVSFLQEESTFNAMETSQALGCSPQCVRVSTMPLNMLPAGPFMAATRTFSELSNRLALVISSRKPAMELSELRHGRDGTNLSGTFEFLGRSGLTHYDDADERQEWLEFLGRTEDSATEVVNKRSSAAQTVGLARYLLEVSTLFASRQFYVGLKSLKDCGSLWDERQTLLKLQGDLHTSLVKAFPWNGAKQSKWNSLFAKAKRTGNAVRAFLARPEMQALLENSQHCHLAFEPKALVDALTLPQRKSVQPKGAITRASRLHLKDYEGKLLQVPMLGIGTGFNDCFQGKTLDTHKSWHDDGSSEEILKPTKMDCDKRPPEGWATDYSLVDTAPLYGSEEYIGEELRKSGRPRQEFFVITKPPVKAMWSLLGIGRGAEAFSGQLKALQTDYVDVLMAHHDSLNSSEWLDMETTLEHGHARALGATSLSQVADINDCVAKGLCKRAPVVAEERWSPCDSKAAQRIRDGEQVGLLATGTVLPCIGEPHIESLATHLGTTSGAVSVRWALQTGAPVLLQTHQAEHLHADAAAMDVQLNLREMGLLGILSLLYRVHSEGSSFDGIGLLALGEEDEGAWQLHL